MADDELPKWGSMGLPCPISPQQSFGYRHVCPEHPAPERWLKKMLKRTTEKLVLKREDGLTQVAWNEHLGLIYQKKGDYRAVRLQFGRLNSSFGWKITWGPR